MAAQKWLLVGLGNPGPGYSRTRHNVGYWCINRLARRHGISMKPRRLATAGEGSIAGSVVLLAKPRTYVNQAGRAVSALLKRSGISPQQLLVVCDDLDLPIGRLRLRPGGGYGGHNGLRSIIGAIGSDDFPRLRIGIGRPVLDGQPVWAPDAVAVYVLSDPPPEEAEALQAAAAEAAQALETVVKEGLAAAMDRYNH